MHKKIHKIAYNLLKITLFLLPLHAFGTVVLNYGFNLAEIFGSHIFINMWKEIVLIILTILCGIQYILKRQKPTFDLLDKIILGFFIFGIAHYFILIFKEQVNGIEQLIWGVKYDYLFLFGFLIIKHLNFTKQEVEILIKSVLFGGGVSIVLSIIIHFFITPENLVQLGFRNDWSTWYPNMSLAFCQKIENMEVCRMSGTFSGPNQFGAYLTMILPLFWVMRKWSKFIYFILALGIISLIFTYSRAAYISLFVALIILFFPRKNIKLTKKQSKLFLATISSFILLVVTIVLTFLRQLLIRPESTSEHLIAWKLGLTEILAHPFGQGLGSAGPASYRINTPIIPENWYLQIGVELGIIGFIIFIIIFSLITYLLIKNYKDKFKLGTLAGFLALSSTALFLHTFEDASTILTLFFILGLILQSEKKISLSK